MKRNPRFLRHIAFISTLALAFTASGCKQAQNENASKTSEAVSSSPVNTSQPENDYGTITTVKTSSDFKGNVGEVTLESGDTYAVIKIKGYDAEIKCKLFPEAAPEGVKNFIETAKSGYYSGKEFHRVISDFMIQGGSANGDGMSDKNEPKFYVEYNANMRHFYGALCYANGGGVNGRQFYIVNNKSYQPLTKASFESQIQSLDMYISQLEELLKTAEENKKEIYKSNLEYYKTMKASALSSVRALDETTEEITEKYKKTGGVPFLDGGYTVFGQTIEGFETIDAISKIKVEAQPGSDEISRPVEKIIVEYVNILNKN